MPEACAWLVPGSPDGGSVIGVRPGFRWPSSCRDLRLLYSKISDILSDMKTFTVRELDREPAVVLAACEREGAVRIRRRDGRSYTVRPDAAATRKVAWRRLMAEHRGRIARIFPEPLPKAQVRLVDQLIGGE
jgi:hypothetical protein